jgi:hypothetical protein
MSTSALAARDAGGADLGLGLQHQRAAGRAFAGHDLLEGLREPRHATLFLRQARCRPRGALTVNGCAVSGLLRD